VSAIVAFVVVLVGFLADLANVLDFWDLKPGNSNNPAAIATATVPKTTHSTWVSFTYPRDGLKVPRCVEHATGTANRQPNEAIFIFVHSAAPKGLGKAFYLQNKAAFDSLNPNKWTADYLVIGDDSDANKAIRIMAVVSTGGATETLDALVKHNIDEEMILEELPEGARPAGKADVIRLPGNNCPSSK
jgi:hypothetical protein